MTEPTAALFVDAAYRHVDIARQAVLADAQRLQKLLQQQDARVNARWMRGGVVVAYVPTLLPTPGKGKGNAR